MVGQLGVGQLVGWSVLLVPLKIGFRLKLGVRKKPSYLTPIKILNRKLKFLKI